MGYSTADYAGSAVILAVLVGLGIVYWFMLTMCDPYGQGDVVYRELDSKNEYFVGMGVVSALTTLVLVTLDVLYWQGLFKYLARILIAGNVALYFLTALAGTKDFPASPIAVYFLVSPAFLWILRLTLLRTMDPIRFLRATGVSLLVVAVLSVIIFAAYAFGQGNFWNNDTKVDYYRRLGCISAAEVALIPRSNYTAYFKELDLVSKCNEAFLFWISPIILILFSFAMGGAVLVIVHSEKAFAHGKKKIDLQVRAFVTFLVLGFLGLYCATGIGGADQGLSTVVFTFTFLLMVIGCGAIVFIEGVESFTSGVKQQPLVARVIGWTKSDWMRSLLLVLFFPLIFLVLPLAFLNQLGRKYLFFTKNLDDEERQLTISVEIHSRIQSMKRWHWTSVLSKVIWWGVIFFSLSVIAARFINVFFSWLNEILANNNIGIAETTFIFYFVGLFCFVLPPIPGVPVYIACAVIIVPTCERYGWNFWGAWLYASLVAWVVRISAVVVNQICIGKWFGSNSVAVKRAVNVNSVEMRAIKKILLTKGLTVPKCAALVGGPDWPMCVAGGILRTPVVQSMIGTSPVIVVIVPVTLAGALILRRSEGGVWVSAASMSLALTALVQTLLLGVAAYYIEKTINDHREELMSWPDDDEVKKFDTIASKRARTRQYISEWSRLPAWLKTLISFGVIVETASAYIFQLLGSRCFMSFDITDNIERDLDNNVLNVIKPLGWVGIGMFAVGCVVLIILGRWISLRVYLGDTIPPEQEERLRQMSIAGTEYDEEDQEPTDIKAVAPASSTSVKQ